MNINSLLYIGNRWQYRYEPALSQKYILFDIFTTKEYYINRSIASLLSQIELYSTIPVISHINSISENVLLDIFCRLNRIWEGLITDKPTSRLYKKIDLEAVYSQYHLSFPKSVEIQITDKCNLRCKHCIVSCDGFSKTECISHEYWIKCIRELDYNRVFKVTLTGGEIFTYQGIKEILPLLGDTKIHYYVLSNGILIDDTIAMLLSKPNITASISIDGIRPDTHDFLRGKNAYQLLKRGLETLLRHDVSVDLSVTIHAKNYTEIADLINYAINIGCHGISFILLDTSGRAELNPEIHLSDDIRRDIMSQLHKLKEEYRDRIIIHYIDPAIGLSERHIDYSLDSIVSCTGAVSHIAINPHGDIYPCAFAFGLDDFYAANIKNSSIEYAWETSKWDIMRGKTKYRDLKICSSCSLRKKCSQQSCRIRALRNSGDYYGMPRCARSLYTNNQQPIK